MKKFCYVSTIPQSTNVFLRDVIHQVSQKNQVTIVTRADGKDVLDSINATFVPVLIERKPSILKDVIALWQLVLLFRMARFDVIHSITPKAGLLAMLAGFITRAPVRIHTFTGQVWCNMWGLKRWGLKFLDKFLVLCSTHILVDSPSQKKFLISEGILRNYQATVLGKGSICGVDTDKFHFNAAGRAQIRSSVRAMVNASGTEVFDEESIIVLFMARLTKQKGILELAEAFNRIAKHRPNVFLYVIGPEENVKYGEVLQVCGDYKDRVLRLEYTNKPEDYLSAADILCLPSHMEGFGQVLINASACRLPVIASRIYGITDAVEENVTGLLYPVGDIDALSKVLLKLVDDRELRINMGRAGRERVLKCFDKNLINSQLVNFYDNVLSN